MGLARREGREAEGLIALLTDFGESDGYAAALRGVLLREAPEARLVDVAHEIAPGDVLAAAWVLKTVWRSFPSATVFLCVVDPEVGTARRPIAIELDGSYGVGPDNGLFALAAADATLLRAFELTRREIWSAEPSATFHGRDVFAPVAAAIARGTALEKLGEPIASIAELPIARPRRQVDGAVIGQVIHVDRFGNLITDIPGAMLGADSVDVIAGPARIHGLARTYADAGRDEPIALVNSAGHLEIAMNGRSAAKALVLERGDRVEVRARA